MPGRWESATGAGCRLWSPGCFCSGQRRGENQVPSFSAQSRDLLKASGGQVWAIAFSPDGQVLAAVTASEGGSGSQTGRASCGFTTWPGEAPSPRSRSPRGSAHLASPPTARRWPPRAIDNAVKIRDAATRRRPDDARRVREACQRRRLCARWQDPGNGVRSTVR